MLLTVLTLVGLTLRVARFGERVTIQILRPAATDPPMVVRPGETIQVEGIVDAGDAVYKAVNFIDLQLIDKNMSLGNSEYNPGRGRNPVSYFPITMRFIGRAQVMPWHMGNFVHVKVSVIDKAGRTHGSDPDRDPPGNEVLIRVERGR
jgi:hypothetical protein